MVFGDLHFRTSKSFENGDPSMDRAAAIADKIILCFVSSLASCFITVKHQYPTAIVVRGVTIAWAAGSFKLAPGQTTPWDKRARGPSIAPAPTTA